MKQIAVIGTGHSPTGSTEPSEEIAAIVGNGFKACLVETAVGVFPSSPSRRILAEQGYIETGRLAAANGADALFINTVGDYGLWPLRDALSIPVIGAGEASIRLATSLGRRFSIVTIWPSSLGFIYEHVLADTDAERFCAGIHYLSEPEALETIAEPNNFVTEMRACFATSIKRIVDACHRAVEQDGADVIILGCTCMAPAFDQVRRQFDTVPLIDPMTAGYRYTELLVALDPSLPETV